MASLTAQELRVALQSKDNLSGGVESRHADAEQTRAACLQAEIPPDQRDDESESRRSGSSDPPAQTLSQKRENRTLAQSPIPQAPEVELAAAAALYLYPNICFPIFQERGKAEFFFNPNLRTFVALAREFHAEHGHIDPTAFVQRLSDLGQLQKLGGPPFLAELLGTLSPPESFSYHLDILRDKYVAREATRLASRLAGALPTLTEDELWSVIGDHERAIADLRALESTATRKSPLSVRRFSELVQMTFDELDNYFGDRILAAGQPCTLLGPGGIGKSRLSLQLAVCMITGRDFLGMPTRASSKRWLFIQTENSNRRLNFDARNIMRALELTHDELALLDDCLVIHTLESDIDALLTLSHQESYTAVKSLIHDVQPDFVQWDPLNSLTDQDLNSDMDMRALVAAISSVTQNGRQDRVPLVLHHAITGKLGAARAVGWEKTSYGRNSKVLQAWTRAQINMAPRSPDNPNLILLSCGKNNNGKPFPEIGVIFDEDAGIYLLDEHFDPAEFREDVGIAVQKRQPILPEDVALLCQPKTPKPQLVKRIKEEFGVQQRAAYDAIDRAKDAGFVKKERGPKWNSLYSPATPKMPQNND